MIVAGAIASLKVALSLLAIGTPVAALVGSVAVTVGLVISAAAPVVNFHT